MTEADLTACTFLGGAAICFAAFSLQTQCACLTFSIIAAGTACIAFADLTILTVTGSATIGDLAKTPQTELPGAAIRVS